MTDLLRFALLLLVLLAVFGASGALALACIRLVEGSRRRPTPGPRERSGPPGRDGGRGRARQ